MNREHLIYKKAVEKWGVNDQLDQTTEECAELIQSLNKFKRKRGDFEMVVEEVVDVQIMINQVKVILSNIYGKSCIKNKYKEIWDKKIERISKIVGVD